MLDMHAHILPNVDDGPKSIEESIALIRQAVNEGITDMIATPHAYSPQYDVSKADVLKRLSALQNEVTKIGLPIQLYAGQEIRIQDYVCEKLKSGEALTLAGSKYVLLELPSSTIPAYTVRVIQDILSLKMIPIIAHPERNRAIADKPNRLTRLIQHGALAQVTAGSLSGHFGRGVQRLALKLIEANLVHTYGSDVHNAKTRPFHFEKGLRFLEKRKLHDAVDILLENNARIVSNENFILLEPGEVEDRKWWQSYE